MALGQLQLALRVAAGLFVVVAPTLMFLALWRGLEAMRDDELIQRARRRAKADASDSEWQVDAAALTDLATSGDPTADRTITCRSCGARNRADVTYCRQCLDSVGE